MRKLCEKIRRLLDWLLHRHWAITLATMALSVIIFGLLSYDFFFLLRANLTFIEENGTTGLLDGGLKQFFMLLCYGFFSLLCYLLFKACEHILTARLAHKPEIETTNAD